MFGIAACLLVATSNFAVQLSVGSWKTDLSKRSIDLAELQSGGPPKDGIPAIDRPKFVGVPDAAEWLDPTEPVMVFTRNGRARAYPIQILIWHELVNDRIGDLAILVSYCPLCNSAIIFDRTVDSAVYDFGVSGLLRFSDMVMYDRQTDSLWQQITGEAIVGALTGRRLTVLPSQMVSFASFAAAFPDGAVLSRETGIDRPYGRNPYAGYESGNRLTMPVPLRWRTSVKPLERLLAVTVDGTTRAYPFSYLRRRLVVQDRIKRTRYVVFFDTDTRTALDHQQIANSVAVGAAAAYRREVDGRRLSFRFRDGEIVNKETGSVWNVLGVATGGTLKGKRLEPVDHGAHFAFAWLVFRPDTQIVGEPGASFEESRPEPFDPRTSRLPDTGGVP